MINKVKAKAVSNAINLFVILAYLVYHGIYIFKYDPYIEPISIVPYLIGLLTMLRGIHYFARKAFTDAD